MKNYELNVWQVFSHDNFQLLTRHLDLRTLDAVTRQLPQGFYSTFRTFEHCSSALGLKAHLDRLYLPAMELGIIPAVDCSQLRKVLSTLLKAYTPGEARVRVILANRGQAGEIFVAIEPLKVLTAETYMNGVRVLTTHIHRKTPRIKSTAFVSESADERQSRINQDIFELLIVQNNRILEGVTSNFFYFKEDRLGTAMNNILLGVTRRTVLRVAKSSGCDILYRPLRIEQLSDVEECFITSSSRGIVPVVMVDNVQIKTGHPGRRTLELMQAYDEYVRKHLERIEIQEQY
jgi:branched-chain amino acid aminotransferase